MPDASLKRPNRGGGILGVETDHVDDGIPFFCADFRLKIGALLPVSVDNAHVWWRRVDVLSAVKQHYFAVARLQCGDNAAANVAGAADD